MGTEKDYHNEDVYGEAFDRYEKALRTWFVAYGIGAMVLFMTQERLRKTLLCDPWGPWVVGLFLFGVFVQVFQSAFYKMCMWELYYKEAQRNKAEEDKAGENERCPCLLNLSEKVERSHVIDIIFDAVTIVLFFAATVMAFCIVIP